MGPFAAAVVFFFVQAAVPIQAGQGFLQEHAQVTPLQKVLQMMADMSAKGISEKEDEQVQFAKFQAFCEDVRADKTKDIAEAAAQIEQLNADIAKAESDAKVLAEEIKGLEDDVAMWEDELKTATGIRAEEKADYDALHTDYSESIDAINRAIAALKQRGNDIPQSLLQLRSSSIIPQSAKAEIESFIALGSTQTPEANAYEFQSGGVVTLLEKLLHKFEDESFAADKAEMNAKANFDLLAQKLHGDLKDANQDIETKTIAKAGRLEDAAASKGDLETTTAAKAEDEKTLSDTMTECSAKSQEFEQNQVTRSEELKALEQARKILASPAVTGNAAKHLPTLVQGAASSFIQLDASEDMDPSARHRVAAFLQSRANKLNSRYLSLVAARVQADPFKKVKKMIKDMIVKLMEEANAEAEHKGFCDTELATNKQTREIKSEKVDALTASIDEHTAEQARLTDEIKSLSDAIGEIKRQQAESTSMREDEKAKNAVAIKDAQDGQRAVEQALKVLKEFYSKQEDASLLQGGEATAQSMSEPYKGMGAESGGILGMLEVILSDFARLEAETSSNEDAAQDDYEKFMADSTEDAAVKQTEMDHKTTKRQRCEETMADLKKDLEVVQEELDAALDYYEKLKPDCLDQGLSYEDRVAQRKEEIVSLQEALKILTGEQLGA